MEFCVYGAALLYAIVIVNAYTVALIILVTWFGAIKRNKLNLGRR